MHSLHNDDGNQEKILIMEKKEKGKRREIGTEEVENDTFQKRSNIINLRSSDIEISVFGIH